MEDAKKADYVAIKDREIIRQIMSQERKVNLSPKEYELGLAIAANVLDRHGWKYSLSYERESKYFTCTIRIPYGLI